MCVEFTPVDGNRWIAAKLINRAGKATGIYSSCWNIQTYHKGEPKVLDFDKDVQKWIELTSIVSDNDCSSEEEGVENTAEVESTAEIANVCQVLPSQIDSEVTGAKQLELQNWVKEDVYDEVIDQGQRHISVRWVVIPKLDNGIWKTKARLIARGFEETENNFRTDSPTCLKESLRVK